MSHNVEPASVESPAIESPAIESPAIESPAIESPAIESPARVGIDRATGDRPEAGFSLLEVTIATVLILMLAYLISTLSITGVDSQKYAERMSRVTQIAQDVTDEVRRDLMSSVQIFTRDPIGNAYLGLLDRGELPEPIAGNRLPRLDATGIIDVDTVGDEKTGNTLFFARFVWTDEFEVSSRTTFRVDVHRLECFYLTVVGEGPGSGRPDGLNLVQWVSEPLADGAQIDAISDPVDRAEMLIHMLSGTPDAHGVSHPPVEVVWKLGEDPSESGTLRHINSIGNLSTDPPSGRANWAIVGEPELSKSGMLFYRHHSIASNFAPNVMGVGKFAVTDTSGDGFPHGMEIQVVGPSSARQVLLHLTMVGTNRWGHRAHQDMQVIADIRDL